MSEHETTSLPRTGLFASISEDEARGIAETGERVSFDEGAAIVEEGDRADAMYVIIDGAARVDAGGRFHVLEAGSFVGEMALLAPGPRMATVRATTPVTALRVPAEAFRGFVLDHPSVALAMMEILVRRLREVEQRIDAWMA